MIEIGEGQQQSQEEQQDSAQAQMSSDESADEEFEDQELPDGEAPLDPPPPQPISDADPNYRVFDAKYDEEIKAEDLADVLSDELLDKHKGFRLNTEVALDSYRAWCPKPGCNTICHICASATNLTKQPVHKARAVNCPKCEKEFCSSCSSGWHPGKTFFLTFPACL